MLYPTGPCRTACTSARTMGGVPTILGSAPLRLLALPGPCLWPFAHSSRGNLLVLSVALGVASALAIERRWRWFLVCVLAIGVCVVCGGVCACSGVWN